MPWRAETLFLPNPDHPVEPWDNFGVVTDNDNGLGRGLDGTAKL